tara:strand:+ start:171 stop:1157 length:987 start_codon:yes stop_codon:yes gene_type:complete
MDLDKTVYSGKQFESYVSIQSDALGTNDVSGTLYKIRTPQINDIDYSNGSVFADAVRSGQRVQRPTDHIATFKGGTFTWPFSDYVVENEAALQMLLQLVSEDSSPSGTVAMTGNQATVVYEEGASTGEYACVVISSPDADEDRLMHSAILQELTLSMNPTQNGGRLTASGVFFSGYQPVIGTEGTSANATAVDFTKGFFDCTTMSIGGDNVVLSNFDVTISNPAQRVGYSTVNSITHEPSAYMRGGMIEVTGNVSAKLDDNVTDTIDDFRDGTSVNISIGDGSSIDFDIPTAKYTGYTHTETDSGVFIDLPFKGTADGSNALITIIAT